MLSLKTLLLAAAGAAVVVVGGGWCWWWVLLVVQLADVHAQIYVNLVTWYKTLHNSVNVKLIA